MGVCILGSINLDVVHRVERLPRPGETVAGLGTARFLGGKGANQAIAAARMGAGSRLIGAVGEDTDGQALVSQLAIDGVDVASVRRAGPDTGAAHICVSADGENMIVVTPGANAAVTPEMVRSAIRPGDRVFLSQLETPIEALRALYESGPARAGLKLLNAAPALADGAALFGLIDLLVVNETELAVYAGLKVPPVGADAVAAAGRLAAEQGVAVIVTLGAAGAVMASAGEALIIPGRTAAAVVDTTGAGDCFCGALAAALSRRLAPGEALAMANAAACLSVGRAGAGPSMPRRAEVEAMLRADA